jgi:hypothetical protein
MNSPADSHARHVLTLYSKSVAGSTGTWEILLRLIAEQIRKAVSEDRETLREQLPCDAGEPCAFDRVCAHHKALADAILASEPVAH